MCETASPGLRKKTVAFESEGPMLAHPKLNYFYIHCTCMTSFFPGKYILFPSYGQWQWGRKSSVINRYLAEELGAASSPLTPIIKKRKKNEFLKEI